MTEETEKGEPQGCPEGPSPSLQGLALREQDPLTLRLSGQGKYSMTECRSSQKVTLLFSGVSSRRNPGQELMELGLGGGAATQSCFVRSGSHRLAWCPSWT